LELALAVHLRLPRTLAATGLTPDEPPHDVHAMARGPLAAGGSTYHADLVLDALDAAGAAMAPGDAALDFGCSSGRVVRVLAALRPDVRWHGCDPNARAIDWASAHLEGIEFRRSPQAPPLAHPDETFGLVYAISVWSHFGPSAAATWLREMHRLIRPGGLLVLTAHGLTSLAFAESGRYPAARTLAVRDALLSAGFSFHDDFGKRGDWGVHDPDWGTSYLTPEWLLSEATPAWSVRAFAPGRNEGNQDVYVLARS
jgi:SAM-dependent methyltransferase